MPPTKKQPPVKATPTPPEVNSPSTASQSVARTTEVNAVHDTYREVEPHAVVNEPARVEHDDAVDETPRELTVIEAGSLKDGDQVILNAEGLIGDTYRELTAHEFGGGANYVPVPGSDAPRSQQEVDARGK